MTSENAITTLEKEGRNPFNVMLNPTTKDLLAFFNGFQYLHDTKREINKKLKRRDIKKEDRHYCWSDDDIKQAWKETQGMDKKSSKRKHWAHVLMLQMLKIFICDECKENAAQEESGVVSESQPTTSSRDAAPSSTEVNPVANPNNSETNDAELVNENEDASVNYCEQQKLVVNCELCVADVHDKENVSWENGLRSTGARDKAQRMKVKFFAGDEHDVRQENVRRKNCSKAERIKGNSEDGSPQSNDVLETVGAAGGVQQSDLVGFPPGCYHGQTYGINQGRAGTQFPAWSQTTGIHSSALYNQGRPGEALGNRRRVDETICIRIPLSVMLHNERRHMLQVQNVASNYKLIVGVPSNTEVSKRKSYAMSFNNQTGNAEWVYEILNTETSVNNCRTREFGNPYHRGHLAAAANHRWCWEAFNDTNLNCNISPQHRTLNQGPWKMLENRCRDLSEREEVCNVHVYSGPLYLQDEFGQWCYGILQGKRVPTHFFKVIIVEKVDGTVVEPECYLMPNDNPPSTELTNYIVDIEHLERVSGLRFIERRTNESQMDGIIMATLQGEDVNSTLQNVNIGVRYM